MQDIAKTLQMQKVGYILDILAFLCDGQNTEVQTLLRTQEADFSVSFTDDTWTLVQVNHQEQWKIYGLSELRFKWI